jgi:endonuclease YncB( thermonuclease family)
MIATVVLSLVTFIGALQAPCTPGQVTGVDRGRDYTITICDVGVVGLRGVEPTLRVADGFPPLQGPVSGEVLGQKDVGPEGLAFLSSLLVGQRVTLVYDGWRIGDFSGRRYAYAFLPNKTLVNAELIKRGYAYAAVEGAHPRRDEFRALEAIARKARVGLWVEGG